MKYDFAQESFASGEISPRAQGQVSSDIYKSALKRAANVLPTQQGSVASRAGGAWLRDAPSAAEDADGFDQHGVPVGIVAIHDGPYGNMVLDSFGRMHTAERVQPWGRGYFGLDALQSPGVVDALNHTDDFHFSAWQRVDFLDSWVDGEKVYLRNLNAQPGQRILLSPKVSALTAELPLAFDGSVRFSFAHSGDPLVVEVLDDAGVVFSTTVVNAGRHDIDFAPAQGGNAGKFQVRISTALDTAAACNLWGIDLRANSVPYAHTIVPVTHAGACAFFWAQPEGQTQQSFFIIVLRRGRIPRVLMWRRPGFLDRGRTGEWFAADMQFEGADAAYNTNVPDWATKVTTCVAHQERLWFGCDDAFGSVHASVVGYGVFGIGALPGTNSAALRFNFSTAPDKSLAVVAGAGQTDFAYQIKTRDASQVNVTRNGAIYAYSALVLNPDQDAAPGGTVTLPAQVGGEAIKIIIKATPKASDSLDLKLASPTGKIAWMAVLRGLLLGTRMKEEVFSNDLAVDPATGASIEIKTESGYGSAPDMPALDALNKIAFLVPGRKRMRMVGQNFSSFGGLYAEDVTILGEHLTKKRVRAVCFLRAPTPRLVFGFDDGSGAIASMETGKATLSWARFTLPTPHSIYSLAAMDGDEGTELWVGTEAGAILRFDNLESDIVQKSRQLQAVPPNSAVRVAFDQEQITPPVMDGWVRCPVYGDTIARLPPSYVGRPCAVVFNETYLGTFIPTASGAYASIALPVGTVGATWVDPRGARAPSEVTVGLLYDEHRFTSLPLEGGNPAGSSQTLMSRKVQLYLRFVDSYMPKVNGTRPPERNPADETDLFAHRVTGDRRCTELGFSRAATVDVVMDYPLRMEISGMFGGTQVNNL